MNVYDGRGCGCAERACCRRSAGWRDRGLDQCTAEVVLDGGNELRPGVRDRQSSDDDALVSGLTSSTYTPPRRSTPPNFWRVTAQGVLTGLWDGVPVVQSSDSNFVTGTRFGLNWTPSEPTATFDNLEIYNMGAPVARLAIMKI